MADPKLQQGKQWLEEFLRLAALPASVHVDAAQPEHPDGSYWLTIDGDQLTVGQIHTLTGSDGSTIDSIQYLINTVLNLGQADDQRRAYTVELDGYRARRQAELQDLASQAAEQVRRTGEEYEMEALSSAERRQVHTFLKSFEDLETYSRGQEPHRKLVICPLSASQE